MKKIIKKIKILLYSVGILVLFCMVITFVHDILNGELELYSLVLAVLAGYALIIMCYKIITSIDYLERVKFIMHNKNKSDKEKIESLKYLMFDIDDFLNDYSNK